MVAALEIIFYIAMFGLAGWFIFRVMPVVWRERYTDENGKKRWRMR